MPTQKAEEDVRQQWDRMLAAFDEKSRANREKATTMVLVEEEAGRFVIRLWHGAVNPSSGQRHGIVDLATYEDEGEARQAADLLVWWMQQALNLYGKPATLER